MHNFLWFFSIVKYNFFELGMFVIYLDLLLRGAVQVVIAAAVKAVYIRQIKPMMTAFQAGTTTIICNWRWRFGSTVHRAHNELYAPLFYGSLCALSALLLLFLLLLPVNKVSIIYKTNKTVPGCQPAWHNAINKGPKRRSQGCLALALWRVLDTICMGHKYSAI